MAVLRQVLARLIERIEPIEARRRGARRPARVERIERTLDAERSGGAVVEGGALQRDAGPAVEQMVVLQRELGAGAIDVAAALDAERRAGTGEVALLQREGAGIGAAFTLYANAGLQRPGVARHHLDVDDAVLVAHRTDLDLVHRAVRADQPFRLLDQAQRYALTRLEQEVALDEPGPRLDVQEVRGAVGELVLVRILEVEDVVRIDLDLADQRAGALVFGEGRQPVLGERGAGGGSRGRDDPAAGGDAAARLSGCASAPPCGIVPSGKKKEGAAASRALRAALLGDQTATTRCLVRAWAGTDNSGMATSAVRRSCSTHVASLLPLRRRDNAGA